MKWQIQIRCRLRKHSQRDLSADWLFSLSLDCSCTEASQRAGRVAWALKTLNLEAPTLGFWIWKQTSFSMRRKTCFFCSRQGFLHFVALIDVEYKCTFVPTKGIAKRFLTSWFENQEACERNRPGGRELQNWRWLATRSLWRRTPKSCYRHRWSPFLRKPTGWCNGMMW